MGEVVKACAKTCRVGFYSLQPPKDKGKVGQVYQDGRLVKNKQRLYRVWSVQ
jgi:hypothetical protein